MRPALVLAVLFVVLLASCGPSESSNESARSTADEPASIRLSELFTADLVRGDADEGEMPPSIEWKFDGEPPEPEEQEPDEEDDGKPEDEDDSDKGEGDEDEEPEEEEPDTTATWGFEPFVDIDDLEIKEGRLRGTSGEIPVLRVKVDPVPGATPLHSIEVKMRVSEGTKVAALLVPFKGFERKRARKRIHRSRFWSIASDLRPGDKIETYVLEATRDFRTYALDGEPWHMLFQPTDAEGATFEIESIRLVTSREHPAKIPSGTRWQGLGEIFRETLVLRSSQSASFDVTLPSDPWLELAIGSIEPHPLTFRVTARDAETGEETRLLKRTVTRADRWEETPLDLTALARRDVSLEFAVDSETPGTLGFFGTAIVRNRGASADVTTEPGTSEKAASPPQGVILVLADTLRRDHLEAYGYERATAPTIKKLADQGALFEDDISQGTWTKVSVPSILTSLYPTSHGISTAAQRLPDSVTTIAEVFQNAGYATFATSSVAFSGKMSNLQQGVDILHERASVGKLDHSSSKTARTFVDRTLDWLEEHRDVPFFIFLHVFDPHSPFEPYRPYGEIWSTAEARDEHEKDVEVAEKFLEEQDKEVTSMPKKVDLVAAGIDPDTFVAREIDWYDESIRAMDVEIARVVERLEELGLVGKTVMAFISDHGEEFLEHGRHFHGDHTYGEMTNVPLFLWGPGYVPEGVRVPDTVQSIDLMPTLLEIAHLANPEAVQGQSLLPLMTGTGDWTTRPAFSERRRANFDREPEPDDIDSYSIVVDGYRLVQNIDPPEGMAEIELFDHAADPLNLKNLADAQPDRAKTMLEQLELWKKWAAAHQVEGGGDAALTPEERAQLEALGYAK